MTKLTIIKLALIPAIIVWWVCIFVLLEHLENLSKFSSIALILSGVLLFVGFGYLCRWSRFRWCTDGRWTKENRERFKQFSVVFGMLQVLTGNRFKPRTDEESQPIDDAGMVRVCLIDSIVELILNGMVIFALIVKVTITFVKYF